MIASTASATRVAWGNPNLSVLAGITAGMYWTMNVQTATPVTAGIAVSAAVDAFGGVGAPGIVIIVFQTLMGPTHLNGSITCQKGQSSPTTFLSPIK